MAASTTTPAIAAAAAGDVVLAGKVFFAGAIKSNYCGCLAWLIGLAGSLFFWRENYARPWSTNFQKASKRTGTKRAATGKIRKASATKSGARGRFYIRP